MKKWHWFTLICMALSMAAEVARCVSTWGTAPSLMLVALVPSLIVPLGVSVYLLCGDKLGNGKNGLFSALMGWQLLLSLRGLWSAVNTLIDVPIMQTWVMLMLDVLILGGTVLLFVGALGGFRRVALYKTGAFLNAALTALYLVFSFIGAFAVSYFEGVPDGVSPVNWLVAAQFATTVLFYAGLGVLDGE